MRGWCFGVALAAASLASLATASPRRGAPRTASANGGSRIAERAAAPRPLPPLGLAFPDSAGIWCGTFEHGGLSAGERLVLVFPQSRPQPAVDSASYAVRVRRVRADYCRTEFGAVTLGDSSRAYDLEPVGSAPPEPYGALTVALAVASAASWTRAADGTMRADLDGDGRPEVARACLEGEGWRFTVESDSGRGARLRWSAYFDLGAEVEPTCGPSSEPPGDR